MGIERIAGTAVATVGGAYMVYKGAKNWYNGKDIGKIQVAIGIIGLAGGVYSLMNLKQASQIDAHSILRNEIEKSCAEVLKKGYGNIPGLDLERHVWYVGPNLFDGVENPRCDTELTAEGKQFLIASGLKEARKYMYEAFTETGRRIHGVIRHYHSYKV